MSFTQKERVIAQIEHRETDFIPYTLDAGEPGKNGGEIVDKLDEYFGGDAWQKKIDNAIRYVPNPTDLEPKKDETSKYSTDWYGSIWRIDELPQKLIKPVLKGPTLEGYKFPNVEVAWNQEWREKALKFIEENKDYFLVACGIPIYERVWYMRGFENSLIDVAANTDFYIELFDAVVEHQMQVLYKLLSLPVDGVFFGDDWGIQNGVMIGAERWRKIIKPRMAKIYQHVHDAGMYTLSHCCGSIEEIIPDLIEIGLDVYESVQPEAKNNNPYDLKKKYGDKITFWGGLGVQSTIPFGTPAEIKKEINKLCCEMGKGGGYILSMAKPFQPETPIENAVDVIEGFLEQAGNNL